MPTWLAILCGIVGGLAVIAIAIFLAVRPYLDPRHESRLPPPRDGAPENPYT